MADGFAVDADHRRFGSEVPVGVDFHLHAAVTEDALGHDRDGVDAVVFGRDDEGRGLVVGIGRSRPDAGDERASGIKQRAGPRLMSGCNARCVGRDARCMRTTGSTRTSRPSSLA